MEQDDSNAYPGASRTVLLFLGPPGSGKSSQAQRVAQQLGLRHLSSGDLLREHKAGDTPLGRYMRENWNVRALSDIAVELVLEAVLSSGQGCLLDGTPRTQEEAIKLFTRLQEERVEVQAMFEFYADATDLVGRLLGRRIHSASGAIHHVSSLTPLASAGHAEDDFIRREDDHDEVEIQKRMRSYQRFMPALRKTLLQYCKGTGAQMHKIDASRTQEEIFDQLMQIITKESTRVLSPCPQLQPLQPKGPADCTRKEMTPPLGFKKAGAVDHCIVKQQIKEISGAKQITTFPGTHPVTLARYHLPLLGAVFAGTGTQTVEGDQGLRQHQQAWRSQYLVTDKLDGERYFLYLDRQQCWLVDRRLNVFASNLSNSWKEDYAGTLLDGELVSLSSEAAAPAQADSAADRKRKRGGLGDEKASQVEALHFVAFDVLSVRGSNVTSLPFSERLDEVRTRLEELFHPTASALRLPLTLHLQGYVAVHELPSLLLLRKESECGQASASKAQLLPSPLSATTSFPTDGLIFQNALSSYRVGHGDDLLKWKDPHHNTIDFRLGWWQGCVVNKQGDDVPFDWIKAQEDDPGTPPKEAPLTRPHGKRRRAVQVEGGTPADAAARNSEEDEATGAEETPAARALEEGVVVECWWDIERRLDDWYYEHWYGADFKGHGYGQGGWRVLRVRTDKETPNVDWVAKSVWESINQHITLDDITAAVKQENASS